MPTLPPIRRSLQTVALAVLVLAAGCSSAQKEIRTASGGALPDAVAVVKESVAAIVERDPDAAAAKFTKMSSGLFAFYRGTSDLFYKYNEYYGIDESFVVRKDAQLQLHGDFHLENFGAYRSETGNVVFDLVDFDDTFRGPYLLDLRRMAVSLMIVCEEKGMAPEAEQVVMLFLRSYEQMMRSIAAGDRRADFCYRNGADVPAVDTIISAVKRIDRHEFLEKVCRTHISAGGSRRFNDDKGYAQVADLTSLKSAMDRYLDTVLPEYRKDDDYYAIKDAVISRRGGIGSAGKLRYLVLIEGMTE
ncbi:MAG TPA: DUF2252 family protein, partial [bacterium]|nr:DUF2252 family protein [bacterium]